VQYNASVFAYGQVKMLYSVRAAMWLSCWTRLQTGSGKSHTMLGYQGDPGLIPRVSQELFRRIADNDQPDVCMRVSVSFMEIYNERVRDLLNMSSDASLRVRNNPKTGPYVGVWPLCWTGCPCS
jgi:hypothetical protein